MIKNDREYKISRAQAQRFRRALGLASQERAEDAEVHPRIRQAERDALRSQLEELEFDLRQYEALQSGEVPVPAIRTLSDLPRALVQARIAAGLSQEDLALRLGLKAQQVQRYESTDYSGASLARLIEVAEALGIQMHSKVQLKPKSPTPSELIGRLNKWGIPRDLVLDRLLPMVHATEVVETPPKKQDAGMLARVVAPLERVFGWSVSQLSGATPPALPALALQAVRFKKPRRPRERRLAVHAVYAHYIALLLLRATEGHRVRRVPTDPGTVRKGIIGDAGVPTLRSALNYVWSLGIPVLPLRDAGAFHAACWRSEGRNVIVLKQRTQSHARWIHDLLHELWHASREPEQRQRTAIDLDDETLFSMGEDEEGEATQFAIAVALGGREEDLAQECVKEARGSVERLKGVVSRVAAKESVMIGALANYMAFRLGHQGIDWWGAATNLQEELDDPWTIARDTLLWNVKFEGFDEVDSTLLVRALSDL